MNNFALKIWDDESSLVTYYTVHREGEDLSETDQFFERFDKDQAFQSSLQELTSLLFDVIGNQFGAHPAFFNRFENAANALPPSRARLGVLQLQYPDFPLRLYCYRLNDEIVILFSGGVKRGQSVQEDPHLFAMFNRANYYVNQIEKALRNGIIRIDNHHRLILDFQGNTEIYFT